MDPKPRPNQQRYLETLRRMTDEQRLSKAFELTELARSALKAGLRQRYPGLDEASLHKMYLERLAQCHNKNY